MTSTDVPLPVVFKHQLDFTVAYCAKLKERIKNNHF